MTNGGELRRLLEQGETVLVPGCGDALTARMVQEAGFAATCLSGAWVAALRGFRDVGLITLAEMVESARYASSSISIPLLADADTGFGGPWNVARCVHDFEAAGAASIQIEDQGEPKRCGLLPDKIIVPKEEMVDRIRVAARARRTDMVILARSDALASEGLDATVDRGKAYLEAGADALFVEAITSAADAERIGQAFPESYLVFNQTPGTFTEPIPIRNLAGWGYNLVYFSTQLLLTALATQRRLLAELAATGSCDSVESQMLSITEFFGILPEPDVVWSGSGGAPIVKAGSNYRR